MSELVFMSEKVDRLLAIYSRLKENQPIEYVLSLGDLDSGQDVFDRDVESAFFSSLGVVMCIYEGTPLTESIVLTSHGQFLESFFAGQIFMVVSVLDFVAKLITDHYTDQFDSKDSEFIDAVEVSAFLMVKDGKKALNVENINKVLESCGFTSRAE